MSRRCSLQESAVGVPGGCGCENYRACPILFFVAWYLPTRASDLNSPPHDVSADVYLPGCHGRLFFFLKFWLRCLRTDPPYTPGCFFLTFSLENHHNCPRLYFTNAPPFILVVAFQFMDISTKPIIHRYIPPPWFRDVCWSFLTRATCHLRRIVLGGAFHRVPHLCLPRVYSDAPLRDTVNFCVPSSRS